MNASDITASLARFKPSSAEMAMSDKSARRVAQEFEAVFLSEMLGPVFESVDTDGLFGGGEGEKVFRSLMVQEYGKAIAQSGGVGIADAVQREILKMQENQR